MHQDNDLAFDTIYHNAEIIDAMKEWIQTMRNIYVDDQEYLAFKF